MKFFIFLSLQHAKAQRFLERELLLCILRSFSLAGKLCQKLEMLRRKWMENETLKLQMRNELDMVERMRMVSKIKIYSEISCRFKLTFYTTFTSTTLNIREISNQGSLQNYFSHILDSKQFIHFIIYEKDTRILIWFAIEFQYTMSKNFWFSSFTRSSIFIFWSRWLRFWLYPSTYKMFTYFSIYVHFFENSILELIDWSSCAQLMNVELLKWIDLIINEKKRTIEKLLEAELNVDQVLLDEELYCSPAADVDEVYMKLMLCSFEKHKSFQFLPYRHIFNHFNRLHVMTLLPSFLHCIFIFFR